MPALSTFYVPREAAYRRLAAPTKLVVPLALMTAAFVVRSPAAELAVALVVVLLLRVAAVPWRIVRGFASVLVTLVPLILVLWTVFYRSGEVLLALGPLRITEGGLVRSVATCFRFSAIVLSVPLLLGVMPQQDLVAALRWFRFPYVLCFTMALALRMIPQLERDLGTIRDAQRSRGIELDRGSILTRARRLAMVVLPLMTVSIARLETLARVIESRGVLGARRRTFYRRPRPGALDLLVMAASVAGVAALWWVRGTPTGAAILG